MRVAPLNQLCKLITDGTHYTPPDIGAGVPFLTVKDMSRSGLDFEGCSRISLEEFQKAKAQNSAPVHGDILFSKDGTVGKVHVVTEESDFAVLSSIAILRPDPRTLDAGFAAHYLRSPEALAAASQRKTGSALTRIILKDLKQLSLPVLPLDEQKRIAAILDQADELRRKRQRAIDRLNQLGQAIFFEMFGDPRTNPHGYPILPLGQLVENQDGKRVPVKLADREQMHGQYPYYGASGVIDFVDDYLFDGERLLIGEDGANLLARSSPLAYMARGKFWVNNHAHVLAFNGRANLRFLEFFIEATDVSNYVSGSAQPKLTQKQLNSISVPTPPMSAQTLFAERLSAVEAEQEYAVQSQKHLEALSASLQHRAFQGEL